MGTKNNLTKKEKVNKIVTLLDGTNLKEINGILCDVDREIKRTGTFNKNY